MFRWLRCGPLSFVQLLPVDAWSILHAVNLIFVVSLLFVFLFLLYLALLLCQEEVRVLLAMDESVLLYRLLIRRSVCLLCNRRFVFKLSWFFSRSLLDSFCISFYAVRSTWNLSAIHRVFLINSQLLFQTRSFFWVARKLTFGHRKTDDAVLKCEFTKVAVLIVFELLELQEVIMKAVFSIFCFKIHYQIFICSHKSFCYTDIKLFKRLVFLQGLLRNIFYYLLFGSLHPF